MCVCVCVCVCACVDGGPLCVFQLPYLSGRAVQMASLYVRGLGHLLGANCACGGPLPNDALMPWQSFDGRLFHSKYLLAHSGADHSELADDHVGRDGWSERKMAVLGLQLWICSCLLVTFTNQ